jgi:uncharacterized membrane protein YheB (UPF0754 family)
MADQQQQINEQVLAQLNALATQVAALNTKVAKVKAKVAAKVAALNEPVTDFMMMKIGEGCSAVIKLITYVNAGSQDRRVELENTFKFWQDRNPIKAVFNVSDERKWTDGPVAKKINWSTKTEHFVGVLSAHRDELVHTIFTRTEIDTIREYLQNDLVHARLVKKGIDIYEAQKLPDLLTHLWNQADDIHCEDHKDEFDKYVLVKSPRRNGRKHPRAE